MPTAKNTNKQTSQIGVLPAFAISIYSLPGMFMIPTTPKEINEMIKPTRVAAPTTINRTPISFAMILKINRMMSANVSKKFLELDFMELLPFFAAPETVLETFLAASETLSATLSKLSLIFFSMLLMLTGSPVIIIFSAVVLAAGTKIQKRI